MKDIVSLHMDHKSNLTENQKSFLDDLYDDQILNICRRSIRPDAYQFEPSVLMNKHGKSMEFKEMGEVKRYCLWLWEVGAVNYRVPDDRKVPSNNPAG